MKQKMKYKLAPALCVSVLIAACSDEGKVNPGQNSLLNQNETATQTTTQIPLPVQADEAPVAVTTPVSTELETTAATPVNFTPDAPDTPDVAVTSEPVVIIPEAIAAVPVTTDNSQTPAAEVVAPLNSATAQPANNFTFANTTLGAFRPNETPVASRSAAPQQPVIIDPYASESSPPHPPVTTAPEGFDQSNNSAPYFENLDDIIVFAGQTMQLRVIPKDADGGIPGMFTGPLPEGGQFVDNFDGTKNIVWSPLEPDVGLQTIEITAIDPIEPLYRTQKKVRVFVKLPEDPSTIRNLPPAIDQILPHRARAGDLVSILVKGTDPNGHVPRLEILNPPAGSRFEEFPEDDQIKAFRWQTSTADQGNYTLQFRVTDAIDPSMTSERSISFELSDPNSFIRPGPSLRSLAENRDFHMGYAMLLNWNDRPDAGIYEATAAREYSLMTTENSLKWGQLNPEPNVWRWDAFDREMLFAYNNNQLVHGHTLVWHRQLPQWIQTLPLQKVEGVMLDFISHVVSRYGAHVALWDVVNEAFEDDGTFRHSVWYNALGEGYIEKAFRKARTSSPLSRLIYNDYDVAWEGPKADAMYNLVRRLLDDGVPIDGVGFQMHLDNSFNRFESVRRNFQRFADLGLDIYITELDVSQFTGEQLDQQSFIYREVLSICLEQPACKAMQLWGMTDRYSWRSNFGPLPFDKNFNAKPAYFSLQQRLSDPD